MVEFRKEKKLSQAALAKKLELSQARIAQIESGIGTAQISFDILFNILVALGYDYRVVTTEGGVRRSYFSVNSPNSFWNRASPSASSAACLAVVSTKASISRYKIKNRL